jgi:SAM-dependent methyltransferase
MTTAPSFETFISTKTNDHVDIFGTSINEKSLLYQDNDIGIDWVYTLQHIIAFNALTQICSSCGRLDLLDVGSQFSFITFASVIANVTFIEPRLKSLELVIPGLASMHGFTGEAQSLPFVDNNFHVVTSLHAIEHFGLGRYGDTPDYFGDIKGIKEFYRVLLPEGYLLTSVPAAATSAIEFNEQRKYAPKDFDTMVKSANFEKIDSYISYLPGFHPNGHVISKDASTLDAYPINVTPPVYVALYRAKK